MISKLDDGSDDIGGLQYDVECVESLHLMSMTYSLGRSCNKNLGENNFK
jgi:hypothetical protein